MNSNENLVLELTEICRLCLSKDVIMLPIFDNDTKEDELPLPIRISMCASIQLAQGDGLPALVCGKCRNHLDSWYTFKERCRSSDATLRQYVASHTKMLTVPRNLETDSTSECSYDYPFRRRSAAKETGHIMHRKRIAKIEKVSGFEGKTDKSEGTDDEVSHTAEGPGAYASPSESRCSDNLDDVDEGCSDLEFSLPPAKKHFSCSLCPRTFTCRASLRDHQASHSGVKQFACAECPKTFYTASQLRAHMRTHSPEKPHVCSSCGKAFRKRSNLNLHLSTHSEASPFLCNVCGKRCKTRGSLNSHLLVHSAQKDHTCLECGKSFTWKNCLVAHAKVHRPERPACCERCGKAFKRREELQRHLRTHTGEKPFACVFCERKFSDKWNLTQHVRLHTGDKPYICGVCGQAFTHNVTLRNHARQHVDNSQCAD